MIRVGITQRLSYGKHSTLVESLNLEWGEFLSRAGILPIPLSYAVDFVHYLDSVDAVILGGGNDLYCVSSDHLDRVRDDYEDQVIAVCLSRSIPLLAICRGAQKVAQGLGGDISLVPNNTSPHNINILDSYLSDESNFTVNSYHNYGIRRIDNHEVRIMAVDDGGNIEAFKYRNMLCLMWHVERGSTLGFDKFKSLLDDRSHIVPAFSTHESRC